VSIAEDRCGMSLNQQTPKHRSKAKAGAIHRIWLQPLLQNQNWKKQALLANAGQHRALTCSDFNTTRGLRESNGAKAANLNSKK